MEEEIDYFAQRFNEGFSDDLGKNIDTIHKDIGFDKVVMYTPDFYKSIEPVKQKFTKDGKFDDEAFGKYYNQMLGEYNQVSGVKSFLNLDKSHLLDTPVNRAAGIKNGLTALDVTKITPYNDIQGRSISMEGINQYSKPTQTYMEVAQQQKIYDENGKLMDITAEDYGALNNTFDSPLFMPTYDKDTEVDGRIYKKGTLKLNENGLPYYQKLKEGEDLIGKQGLSSWDVLFKEKNWWNDYNFMENDDFEKSLTGTAFSVAARLIPYVNPYTATAYIATKVGLGLMDGLGTLAKAGMGLSEGDKASDNEYYKMINNFQSKYATLGLSTTINSQQNIMTVENLGNLIVSSIDQLKGQRFIGSLPKMVGMSSNPVLGKAIGATYMTLTQGSDIHKSFKAIGASEKEAAAFYLGTSAVLGSMFFFSPIGNFALKNLDESTKIINDSIRASIKPAVASLSKVAPNIIEKGSTKGIKALVEMGKKAGIAAVSKLKNASKRADRISDSMILEGTEELVEFGVQKTAEVVYNEFSGDLAGIYRGLRGLGYGNKKDKNFQKFKFDNLGQEALITFGGGAVGGAVFKMHDKFLNLDQGDVKLEQHILNGNTDEVLEQVDKLWKKGFVDKTLSYKKDEEGNHLIYDKDDATDKSLNDIIYEKTKEYVLSFDNVMKENGVPFLQDIEAFYDKTLNQAITPLQKEKLAKQLKTHKFDFLINAGYDTTLSDDLQDIFHNLVEVDRGIKALADVDVKTDADKLTELSDKKAELKQKLDDLKSGKEGKNYFMQALFMLNHQVNSKFGKTKSANDFLKEKGLGQKKMELQIAEKLKALNVGKTDPESLKLAKELDDKIKELEEEVQKIKEEVKTEYAQYKATNYKQDFKDSYKEFVDNYNANPYFKAINNSNLNEMVDNFLSYYGEGGISIKQNIDKENQFDGDILASFIDNSYEISLDFDSNKININGNEFEVESFVEKFANLDEEIKNKIEKDVRTVQSNILKNLGDVYVTDFEGKIVINEIIDNLVTKKPNDPDFMKGLDLDSDDVESYKTFYDTSGNLIPEKINLIKQYQFLENISRNVKNKTSPTNKLDEIFKDVKEELAAASKKIKEEGAGGYSIPSTLLTTKKELEKIEGLIFASKELNPIVNVFDSETLNKKDLRKEYSEDEYLILRNYVKELTRKIDYLIRLDEFNRANLLSTILREKSNMISEMGTALKDLSNKLGIDLSEFSTLVSFDKGNIKPEELKDAEIDLSKLETLIYEKYQNEPEKGLINTYLEELKLKDVTAYNDFHNFNGDKPLKKSGLYLYLNTILRFPSNRYNKYLKSAIEDSKMAPIFTQKYVMRQAFSAIVGDANTPLTDEDLLNYVSTIFLRSRDGAGKTRLMLPLLLNMLNLHYENNVDLRISAPFKEQVANMSEDLEAYKESIKDNAEEVFNSYFSETMKKFIKTVDKTKSKKEIEKQINDFIGNLDSDLITKFLSKDEIKKLNLVVLDEATLVDPIKLKVLGSYFQLLNSKGDKQFKILAIGDPDQSGYVTTEGNEFNIGTEKTEETNKAMISMRSLYEPLFSFNSIIKAELFEYWGKRDFTTRPDSPIAIDYYEGNNKGLIKIDDNHELAVKAITKAKEENLISKETPLLVIGKKPDFLNSILKEEEIKFIPNKKAAQGLQANVVYFENDNDDKTPYQKLQSFNTFLNRAKSLVIFKDNDGYFEKTQVKVEEAIQKSTFMKANGDLNMELIDELKNIELAMLSGIPDYGDALVKPPRPEPPKSDSDFKEKGSFDDIASDGSVLTWSFYTPKNEATSDDEYKEIIELKSALLGYGDKTKLSKKYNLDEAKYRLVGKKYVSGEHSPKDGFGFKSDKDYEVADGDGFVTIEVTLPGLGVANKTFTLSVFPKLDNSTEEGKTIRDAILEKPNGQATVDIIEEYQQKAIEDDKGFSIELGNDPNIVFDPSNTILGKYFWDKKNGTYANFKAKNTHISHTVVIFTHDPGNMTEDLSQFLGRPLLLWSYGNYSHDDLVDQFLNKDKKLGVLKVNTKFFEIKQAVTDIAALLDNKDSTEEDFKKMAQGLISLKSANDLNNILYQLTEEPFGPLRDKYLINPESKDPSNFIAVESRKKYAKADLFGYLIELARLKSGEYRKSSVFDKTVFDALSVNNNIDNILTKLDKHIGDKLGTDQHLFVNAKIDNQKNTINSKSIVAKVDNPEALYFTLDRISMPPIALKFTSIKQKEEAEKEQRAIDLIRDGLPTEAQDKFKPKNLADIENYNGFIYKRQAVDNSNKIYIVSYLVVTDENGIKVEQTTENLPAQKIETDGIYTINLSATKMENIYDKKALDSDKMQYYKELEELASAVNRLDEVEALLESIRSDNSTQLEILKQVMKFRTSPDLYNKLKELYKNLC